MRAASRLLRTSPKPPSGFPDLESRCRFFIRLRQRRDRVRAVPTRHHSGRNKLIDNCDWCLVCRDESFRPIGTVDASGFEAQIRLMELCRREPSPIGER